MSKTVRYGIIGCGMMGHEHIRNIALLPHTSVAAIFDPDSGMQKSAAELAPDAVFTETLEELLGLPDLDCLVVVSPNYLHAEQLRVIASQNPLPLLMEKPLFTDMADAEEIKNYRESYPAPIWVAMEYRYMPIIDRFIQEIRLMQQSDEAIHMLTIREHRFPFLEKVGDWNRFSRNTGGTLVEKCCHFFDLMRFIHQSKPVRVFASGGQSVNHLSERYFGETPDILDNGYVLLDFENGARAMLELCMFADGSRFQESISAVGESQKVECHVPGPHRFWPTEKLGPAPIAELTISPRDLSGERSVEIPVDPGLLEAGDHNGSTYYQHKKFLDVVRNNGTVEVGLNDGYAAVIIGKAAHHSIDTGQPVDLTQGQFVLT